MKSRGELFDDEDSSMKQDDEELQIEEDCEDQASQEEEDDCNVIPSDNGYLSFQTQLQSFKYQLDSKLK